MKKVLWGLVLMNVCLLGGARAYAHDGELLTAKEFELRARKAEAMQVRVQRVGEYEKKITKMHIDQGVWERRGPAVSIPELDASAASAALALLIGGAAVLADRKKRLAV
jgi:hypothetical protein